MWRGVVHREVVVLLNLDLGEVEDMTKRFGSTVFAPDTLEITFRRKDSDPDWVVARVVAAGGRRLKSGAVSTSGERFDYDWFSRSDIRNAPAWVTEAIRANTPGPVADDDLPIVSAAVELDGGGA